MEFTPLWISIKTATAATLVCFLLAIPVARWRMTRRSLAVDIVDGLLLLPLAVPPTVVGLVLLMIFGRNSPVGAALEGLGLRLIFTWPATVLAASVVAFPIMYHTARGAFGQVERELLDAARIFGLSEWRILWSVLLPLAWPGVTAGMILTFLRALGEFGATLMIAGNIPGRTQTAPIAIYFGVQDGQWREPIFFAVVLLAISVGVIALLRTVSRRIEA